MDDARFDALAKRLAGGITRRGVLRGLLSLTGAGGVALVGWGGVAATECADRCNRLPVGSARHQCQTACAVADQARATAQTAATEARATASATGDEARARAEELQACQGDTSRLCGSGTAVTCCGPTETCQDGACVPVTTTTPVPGPCGAIGTPCATASDCCAPAVCARGACAAACPPGYRECDRNCYPGGCCVDADCGLLCQVCGANHVCQPCEAVGLVCQDGSCVPATTTSTTTTTTTTAPPCGESGASCSAAAGCCAGLLCCGGACCAAEEVCYLGTCCTPANPLVICLSMLQDCGPAINNCGEHISCGTCPPGSVCYQGDCCTPTTCAALGASCGDFLDLCGGTLHCGSCPAGQVCFRGTCCTPTPHCTGGQVCGDQPDGCGGNVQCGTCPAGQGCCGGACTDLGTDPANCGGCGHTCSFPASGCAAGSCCAPGLGDASDSDCSAAPCCGQGSRTQCQNGTCCLASGQPCDGRQPGNCCSGVCGVTGTCCQAPRQACSATAPCCDQGGSTECQNGVCCIRSGFSCDGFGVFCCSGTCGSDGFCG